MKRKQNRIPTFARVKLFWLIFSFYIITLSIIPCCDKDTCISEANTEITQTQDHDNPKHHDQCTPFCTCACCPASAFYQAIAIITFNKTLLIHTPQKQNSNYSFIYHKEYPVSIWQPPKLS